MAEIRSDIPCFRFAAFADAKKDGVTHGFFGRRGGFSDGAFKSLNCGPGSGDDAKNVLANRAQVAGALGVEGGKLLSLYQVHGAVCLNVTEGWESDERPEADAFITNVPGIALSILTADCAPVLFRAVGKDGKPVIGAAHAGWRGALAGALESVMAAMKKEFEVKPESVRAAVGPCIQKKSYEVSMDFYNQFMKQGQKNEKFFMAARKPSHLMFDLPGYCAARLREAGVQSVNLSEADTYANEADFFSFRRATHRGDEDYGRQISAIAIL